MAVICIFQLLTSYQVSQQCTSEVTDVSQHIVSD